MADGSGCGEGHVESAGEGDGDGSSVSVERIVSEGVRVSPVTESDTGGSGGAIWEWNGEAGEKDDPAAATEARTTPLVTFTGRFSVRLSDIGKALKSKSSKSVTVYALAKVDQNGASPLVTLGRRDRRPSRTSSTPAHKRVTQQGTGLTLFGGRCGGRAYRGA